MKLDIVEKTRKYVYSKRALKALFEALARHFGIPDDFELAVFFTGKDSMRKANREFLGKDAPTDVLSFPVNTAREISDFRRGRAAESPFALGDIMLCPDHVLARNVMRQGRTLGGETVFLLVHGFMHIIGYDHGEGSFAGSKMEKDALGFLATLSGGDFSGVIRRRS